MSSEPRSAHHARQPPAYSANANKATQASTSTTHQTQHQKATHGKTPPIDAVHPIRHTPTSKQPAPFIACLTSASYAQPPKGGLLMDQDIDTARLKPGLRTRSRNLRACAVCGAPAIGSRCTRHPLERGTTTERGYGTNHQTLRNKFDAMIQAGCNFPCMHPDCGEPIRPGDAWDLGHNPNRTGYLGPMHATCNRRTAKPQQAAA